MQRTGVGAGGVAIGFVYWLSCVAMVLLIAPSMAEAQTSNTGQTTEDRIEELERRIKELERAQEEPAELAEQREDLDGKKFKLNWGGQYRVNAYHVGDDRSDAPTAARVRLRQSLDFIFDRKLETHLQLELGHTSDNVTTTANSSRETTLSVRHAVIGYNFQPDSSNLTAKVGILPEADRFGDVLFSSDWDYNPVALSLESGTSLIEGDDVRSFVGKLWEGEEWDSDDDFTHLQFDYRMPIASTSNLNIGASWIKLDDDAGGSGSHVNYGISGEWAVSDGMHLRAFALGSQTDEELLAAGADGTGFAGKIELSFSELGLDLLGTYASGDSAGGGFLPVMAFAKTNGYWGYTGILTVQGPTDTGFDGDSVNISNNGYGMSSLQARYTRPLTDNVHLYLAGGWYGNTDAPDGRSDSVGWDSILMFSFTLHEYLTLDVGGDYAQLEDSVSGYWQGAVGGADFNQAVGVDRDKYALFTRIQVEY